MSNICENIQTIHRLMKKAERHAGREEGSTRLMAVTKTQNLETLMETLSCGHRLFGENKVQEAQLHWTALKAKHPDIELHLIGPLQTNKARYAVALFDCIQTLDREKLADALSEEMKKQGRPLPCFIQVNTGEEEQKAGIAPSQLKDFLHYCQHSQGLKITGLMCIPPLEEPSALHFALLKKLADIHKLPNLSMGMSADFLKAIPLGATHVRVGSAIFGARV